MHILIHLWISVYGNNGVLIKPLAHLATMPLRLYGVVKFPRAPWDRMETNVLPEEDDCTAFSRRPWRFYGAQWRSYGVLVGDCLRTYCALTALPRRASSCHGAPTALTAFCLHSEVVEITSRVLISQLRHESMLPVTHHASTVCLCPCILKPNGYYALVSSIFICRTCV